MKPAMRLALIGLVAWGGVLVTGLTTYAGETGIGLQVVALPGGELVVVQVVPNSPAQGAGLRPGDLLLSVDERDLKGTKLEAISQKTLWGRAGTGVSLKFLRPGVAGVQRTYLVRASLGTIPAPPPGVEMLQPQSRQNKEDGSQ